MWIANSGRLKTVFVRMLATDEMRLALAADVDATGTSRGQDVLTSVTTLPTWASAPTHKKTSLMGASVISPAASCAAVNLVYTHLAQIATV